MSNLKFALEVDTNNHELENEFNNVKSLIASNTPSLPTTLQKEFKINPFLRCNHSTIKNKVIKKIWYG